MAISEGNYIYITLASQVGSELVLLREQCANIPKQSKIP